MLLILICITSCDFRFVGWQLFLFNRLHYSGLEHSVREQLGYKCKRIIDIGRAKYLEANGYDVNLIYYVEPSTSLENLALIATPNKGYFSS